MKMFLLCTVFTVLLFSCSRDFSKTSLYNEKYRLSVEYPSDWKADTSNNGVVLLTLTSPVLSPGDSGVTVIAVEARDYFTGISFEQNAKVLLVQEGDKGVGMKIKEEKFTEIAGGVSTKFYDFELDVYGITERIRLYIFVKDNVLFLVRCVAPKEQYEAMSDYTDFIVNSISFR